MVGGYISNVKLYPVRPLTILSQSFGIDTDVGVDLDWANLVDSMHGGATAMLIDVFVPTRYPSSH